MQINMKIMKTNGRGSKNTPFFRNFGVVSYRIVGLRSVTQGVHAQKEHMPCPSHYTASSEKIRKISGRPYNKDAQENTHSHAEWQRGYRDLFKRTGVTPHDSSMTQTQCVQHRKRTHATAFSVYMWRHVCTNHTNSPRAASAFL